MLAGASMQQEPMQNASMSILQEALDGVKLYHDSSFQPFKRQMNTVSEQNGTRIVTAANWRNKPRECVILVPSLINTWHIFDIYENHSFAAYLADCHIQPMIVDWALPTLNNKPDIDTYITDHLAPLIRHLVDEGYDIKGIIGYCMGGTILSALASACPDIYEKINKTAIIAGPWGFDYQTPEQHLRIQGMGAQALSAANMMGGIVPIDWVQALFWAIDPLQVLKKFRKFREIDQSSEQAERFVIVEDWLNDGREVTIDVARMCLQDWYANDCPAKGAWIIDGQKVDPTNIQGDVLVAWGTKDNLVPKASAKAILNHLPKAKHIEVDTGHIGLMASDKAKENLWKPVAEFINSA